MTNLNRNRKTDPVFYFDDYLTRDSFRFFRQMPVFRATLFPATNIRETGSEFIVEMSIAGIDPAEVEVVVQDNALVVRYAIENLDFLEGNTRTWQNEHRIQPFDRRFQLPDGLVDLEAVDAFFEHGLLTIVLPKSEQLMGEMLHVKMFSDN